MAAERKQTLSPLRQLDRSMAAFTPEIQAIARAALEKMRVRLPGAVELVYDNYNALVIAFGPTERATQAILSIVLYPRWVTLFFLRGVELSDPSRILKGTGTRVRHIVLQDGAATLDKPVVRALIAQAVKLAKPVDKTAPKRMVIKAVVAKKRARRPPQKKG